ncbi:MAG: histidine kinase dimerization/phospho-acceptor domain-containing protein, partial [Planctomycetota bacterium]
MRLLLIENSHVDSAFVERMLRSAFLQLELVRVENLAKAVLLLEQDMGFDAIIASVSLPDSEGIDTVGRLLEVAAGIPLIALADIEDYGVSKRAIRLGVQDFLSKRILNSETLERSVRYSIERKKLAIRNERLLSSLGESERLLRTRTQKLEKACKTAQTFVENVSHEFRTPLTVIMEYASLLADGVAGSVTEEQSSLLGIIDDRAADLNTMVDDMLDVSKLESGMLGAARCRAEVGEIVSRVLPALQRKSQIREVTLQVDIPEDTPAVYCDSEKTGRVLINLVVNAIK